MAPRNATDGGSSVPSSQPEGKSSPRYQVFVFATTLLSRSRHWWRERRGCKPAGRELPHEAREQIAAVLRRAVERDLGRDHEPTVYGHRTPGLDHEGV